MTTMARTSAALRRLFNRLDSGGEPLEPGLRESLECWRGLRAGDIAPRIDSPCLEPLPASAFLCRSVAGQRDYAVDRSCDALERLLGGPAGRLRSAADRKEAVRLRRLFDLALQTGEHVIAQFPFASRAGAAVADVLAAPVIGGSGMMDSIFGAVSLRFVEAAPSWRADENAPIVFALPGAEELGLQCARMLRTTLSPLEVRDFEDGEHKIRPLTGVRRRDVYVLARLASDARESVNDRLCKLLFFIGALKQSGAASVNVVAPYLCYARKERQTKPRDPVTLRHVAQLLESVGLDRLLVVTVHDLAAFQNAFRCETQHLDTHALFTHALAPALAHEEVCVVSPDPGGEKRAELFRQALERRLQRPVGKALVDKHRSMGRVTGEIFAGDVAGRTAIICDDLVSTGGTMLRAARACRTHGARKVLAVATHLLSSEGSGAFLDAREIDQIWVTDSLAAPEGGRHAAGGRVRHIGLASLLAGAIHRMQTGGSLNDLLEHELALQP
jgi:ribose-phosphate pyrophosphokinase